jgi:protocatechuate 3,4-dioxygenase beta subunit
MVNRNRTGILPGRRQILKTMGAAAAVAGMELGMAKRLLGQSCLIPSAPALTEGPYFVDEILNRSDITLDPADNSVRSGFPLSLTINLKQLTNCALIPLTGAYIDIWHCDAEGVYSDVAAQNTTGKKFLRGYQATDRNGAVRFQTVYPGWYSGRAVHIHSKIRIFNGLDQTYEFTTQFFFDDATTDRVFAASSLYSKRGNRDTLNSVDGIYLGASSLGTVQSNSGAQLMLQLDTSASNATASIDLAVDMSLGSSPDQPGGGGAAGGPGGTPPGGLPPGGPGGPPPV